MPFRTPISAKYTPNLPLPPQEKDVDLLVVDSGDLHDGSGLTDGYPLPGINGHEVASSVADTKPPTDLFVRLSNRFSRYLTI
jgi:hypothetical protein